MNDLNEQYLEERRKAAPHQQIKGIDSYSIVPANGVLSTIAEMAGKKESIYMAKLTREQKQDTAFWKAASRIIFLDRQRCRFKYGG